MNLKRNKVEKLQRSKLKELLKSKGAVLELSDFVKSYNVVKFNYFRLIKNTPVTNIEKALYVSENDLLKALESLSKSKGVNLTHTKKSFIELDEETINKSFEKITH